MEAVTDILLLSSKFTHDYPHAKYPEIMYKQGRPYSCLLIDTHDDYYICVPFRTSISRNNAFFFKNTKRSKTSRSGLDYEKIVLVKDESYLDYTTTAIVDGDEYKEAITNLDKIARAATKYIDDYIAHVKGEKVLHPREYDRKYRFSTLPYFHDIIGIT